jgi:ribosomal protein S6--L-glutamate ligase
MADYFVSMNPLVSLDENLPNLAPLDDPAVVTLIRSARGVVMPRAASEGRYRRVAALARDWFPNFEPKFAYVGKTKQTILFRRLGVRHPRTFIYRSPAGLETAERSRLPLPYPFVLKGDRGGGGSSVYPVSCLKDLRSALGRLPAEEPLLVQEWVHHGGMDLRVVVVGFQMVSYFRVGRGFYNNICRGGRVDRSLFPERQEAGMAAVAHFCSLTGIQVAGFDLMFPDAGPPVFVEINFHFGRKGLGGTPGFRRLFGEAVRAWQRGISYPPLSVKG